MGLDGLDQDGVVADIQAVVRGHEHFDLAQRVVGCHQLGFNVPCQVTAGQERELAKLEQHADALRVV